VERDTRTVRANVVVDRVKWPEGMGGDRMGQRAREKTTDFRANFGAISRKPLIYIYITCTRLGCI